MKIIRVDNIINVPKGVAECPICGGPIFAIPTSFALADDGWKLVKNGCFCSCSTCYYNPEDAVEDTEWVEVNKVVLEWINENFRFADEYPEGEFEFVPISVDEK